MSTPFMSEIKIVSFTFAPKGWAMCNGQSLAINSNQALFSLLGTTYGGDGRTTFALPNLQGRIATHQGSGLTLGQKAGEEMHTLSVGEMPAHVHPVQCDPSPNSSTRAPSPTGNVPASSSPNQLYSAGGTGMQAVSMNPAMVQTVGGSQPHENRMPFLVLNFIIALQGIFPTRN